MKKYAILMDNGVATEFESAAHNIIDILDEFCREAGYLDHQDACQRLGYTDSPFNIVEVK